MGSFFYEKTSIRDTDGLLWKKNTLCEEEKRLMEDQPKLL
ncbi:hypothetical protein RU99_GL000394 [Enterococcus casseliflavus]|nr:hypothetical protein RU99_GL000394 [Enterococcus casseliflavus]